MGRVVAGDADGCAVAAADFRLGNGLALDVDTPEDLRAFLARSSSTAAHRYLTRNGIAERLTASSPGSRLARGDDHDDRLES